MSPPLRDDPHAYDYVSDRRTSSKLKCNLAFRIIIIILLVVCVAFTAAGHGINWASYLQNSITPARKAHVRLWRISVSDDNGSGFYTERFVTVTRAFMITGLVFGVAALILAIVYAVTRSQNEKARQIDDEEREGVRQEYLRRLQERRLREEEERHEGRENSSFARHFDVRPPSHPRSYYIRRENKRLLKDWYIGLAIWILLFLLMASMAIVVGCFSHFYVKEIKDQKDSKLVVGFWLMCASLICSFIAVVLMVIAPATGWNVCIGRPKGREV